MLNNDGTRGPTGPHQHPDLIPDDPALSQALGWQREATEQRQRADDLRASLSGWQHACADVRAERDELRAANRRLAEQNVALAAEARQHQEQAIAFQVQARDAVDRLAAIQRIVEGKSASATGGPEDTAAALERAREAHLDTLRQGNRCVAHGDSPCRLCARTKPGGLDDLGNCTQCGVYASTGHHWDTCANRVR